MFGKSPAYGVGAGDVLLRPFMDTLRARAALKSSKAAHIPVAEAGGVMKKSGMAVLLFMLSGCVSYDWYKEGASYEEKQRQVLSCEAGSLKALPPNYQVSSESSNTTGSTNCEAGVKDSCGKKNKVTTTTDYNSRDVNADGRDTLVKDCMYQKGWRQIEIKN